VSVLMIQGPAERGRNPYRVDVSEGHSATFGSCDCHSCDLDLRITGGMTYFRGVVTSGPSVWWITNASEHDPLFVADVDRPDDPVEIRPGVRLPFGLDMATVSPTREPGSAAVTVFAPMVEAAWPPVRHCPAIVRPREPELDPEARYFAVLAELCAAQVEGPMPTSAAIAARLDLSPRAVDAHIDYLVKKFGIPAPATRSTGWKRTALLAHVRRRRLVATP